MAEPTVIECSSACTVTVVHEISFPPFQLTLEEGGQIAGAILLVWVTGWAFRMVIKAMHAADAKPEDGS